MKNRQTCTDHCSACGRHFHGLAAFDLHLHRVNERKNRWGAPTYDLEHCTEGLEVWAEEGYCDLTGAELPLYPVVIWRKPLTEAEKERLEHLRYSDSHSSEETS